jgi:hypothetical protein
LISRYDGLLHRNDFATVEEIAATPDAGLLAFGDVDVFERGVLHCRGKGIVRCLLVAAHDRRVGADPAASVPAMTRLVRARRR